MPLGSAKNLPRTPSLARRGTPLLHFLVLGLLLFAADRWRHAAAVPAPPPIVISADDVAALRRGWHEQFGREPDAADERALIGLAVDEEVLYREALAAGLDRGDRVVRARLLELARFLRLAPDDDPQALAEAADRLGLERRDVLLRRHLAEMERLALAKGSVADLPSDAALRAYYARQAARFAQPARVELSQVYLSAQRRGPALETDARRLLDELRRRDADPRAATTFGDPFIHGAHVPLASRAEIERLFGQDFAGEVERAPTGRWVGPIRSSYGLHLVWVHQIVATQVPALDAVRGQVLHAMLREHGAQRLHERLAALRARYRVIVAGQS